MPATVPLARIYEALDAQAYRAFRAAERRSRGGTVRLADLVAGLAEVAPEVLSAALSLEPVALAAAARPPASRPDLVPMDSDLALRETLIGAYQRAGNRTITPADIAAVIAAQRMPRSGGANLSPRPPCPFAPQQRAGEAATSLLQRWLVAQSLPSPEREAELARVEPADGRVTFFRGGTP